MKTLKFLGVWGTILFVIICLSVTDLKVSFPKDIAKAASDNAKSFSLGKTLAVDLTSVEQIWNPLTQEQQQEQIRDWLLFTIAAYFPTNTSIADVFYDFPIFRDSLRQSNAALSGKIRFYCSNNNDIITLLPENYTQRQLISVVVKAYRNLGQKPKQIKIFTYNIQNLQQAQLTYSQNLPCQKFFHVNYGFYKARIEKREDLKNFLEKVDDLIFISLKDGLTLGGYSYKDKGPKISLEHIASLWQAQIKLQSQVKKFHGKWQTLQLAMKESQSLPASWDGKQLAKEKQQEQLQLQKYQMWRKLGLTDSLGFSLMPDCNYRGLIEDLRKLQEIYRQKSKNLPLTENELNRIYSFLENNHLAPLLQKIQGQETWQRLIYKIVNKHQLQKAQYYGDIEGTELGMILFYTDLLVKLWAFNYAGGSNIEDFPYLSQISLSALEQYKKQENIRMWLGVDKGLLQISTSGDTLIFPGNITRLYTTSLLSPEFVQEDSASFAATTIANWWNRHFTQIMDKESEYKRLNQIVKWNLLICWLIKHKKNQLTWLSALPVKRTNKFPGWVKEQSHLSFQEWSKIPFISSNPEAFSQLQVHFTEINQLWTFSGGVSLGAQRIINSRGKVNSRIPGASRRSNINYKASKNKHEVVALNNTRYKIYQKGAGVSQTTTKLSKQTRLRNRYISLNYKKSSQIIVESPYNKALTTYVDDIAASTVSVRKVGKGFAIEVKKHDLLRGMDFVKRLSSHANIEKWLSLANDVETFIKLPGKNHYLVKLKNSQTWLNIAEESAGKAHWQARIAGQSSKKKFAIKCLDHKKVVEKVGAKKLAELRKTKPAKLNSNTLFRQFGDCVQQAKSSRSITEIESFIAQYGPRPELVMYRGILCIDNNQVYKIMKNLPKNPAKLQNRSKFIAEVKQKIATSRNAQQAKQIRKLGKYIDFSDLKARKPGIKNTLELTLKSKQLKLHYKLKQPLAKFPKRKINTIPKKGKVYIQDHPRLNKLAGKKTTNDALKEIADIIELIGDIKDFLEIINEILELEPDDLSWEDPKTTYKLLKLNGGKSENKSGQKLYLIVPK